MLHVMAKLLSNGDVWMSDYAGLTDSTLAKPVLGIGGAIAAPNTCDSPDPATCLSNR